MKYFITLITTIFAVTLVCGQDPTQEEAIQLLNSIPYDQLEEADRTGNSDDYISDLWSDIENAFRFLEENNVENELRRIKMTEITKRLPARRHSFVRFGKRHHPSHSFVRFGRSVSNPPPPVSKSPEMTSSEERHLLRLGWPDVNTNDGVLPRRPDATDKNIERFDPSRSADTGYDTARHRLVTVLKSKLPSGTRIGKLPASVFYYIQNSQNSGNRPSSGGKTVIDTLPRYG